MLPCSCSGGFAPTLTVMVTRRLSDAASIVGYDNKEASLENSWSPSEKDAFVVPIAQALVQKGKSLAHLCYECLSDSLNTLCMNILCFQTARSASNCCV